MPTLILSFAPQTREAAAAVTAPRKNLRVLGSVTAKLLVAVIISGGGLYNTLRSGPKVLATASQSSQRRPSILANSRVFAVPSGCKRVLMGMVTISTAPALSLHEPLRSQDVGLAGLGLDFDFLAGVAHLERFGLARRDACLDQFSVLPVERHLETAAGHEAADSAGGQRRGQGR